MHCTHMCGIKQSRAVRVRPKENRFLKRTPFGSGIEPMKSRNCCIQCTYIACIRIRCNDFVLSCIQENYIRKSGGIDDVKGNSYEYSVAFCWYAQQLVYDCVCHWPSGSAMCLCMVERRVVVLFDLRFVIVYVYCLSVRLGTFASVFLFQLFDSQMA